MKSRLIIVVAALLFSTAIGAQPRAEYPRPQFERADWVNLNGEWSFALDLSDSGRDRDFYNSKGFEQRITVPFAPESKLSGIGYTDFINSVWYQRMIQIPSAWQGKRVKLNFGAVYYESEVYIDGRFVGRHYGGSDSFAFDITDFVGDGKEHSIVVHAESDLRSGTQPGGKQSTNYYSYGCSYTRTTGIWQTVWMEAVDDMALERVQVVTDIDNEQIVVIPTYYNVAGGNTLSVEVRDGGKVVAHAESAAVQGVPVVVALKKAKLWSPESPFLYDVVYEVKDAEGRTLDRVDAYVGMRKVHIDGNKIYLNNKPYYQRLVLDQGFYPDGIWTAPSDEALKHDIEMSKAAGFNGARLHQKVFEERFHYWADKLGYIVWGEMASWDKDFNSVAAARNFLSEWGNIVVRDRNHPALIVWTPFNEEFGVPSNEAGRFLTDVYNETRRLDPTRPVNTVSGGIYVISDFCTAHCYEQDGARLHSMLFDGEKFYQPQGPNGGFDRAIRKLYYDGSLPYLLDEFGGIKCAETQPEGGNSWGYGNAAPTREDFYTRLEALVKAIVDHSDKICGFCYTQLTDVEQEQNGVYYYDRGEKFDMGRVKAIFQMKAEGYEQ
ncbi:MAG TPA: beta-glucuronidase [Candidatus Alistipes merdipullorum]|nr:beta-glucuronidase [Candidatus Alistipes merdipullorum]